MNCPILSRCLRYVRAGLPIPLTLAMQAMALGYILDQLES